MLRRQARARLSSAGYAAVILVAIVTAMMPTTIAAATTGGPLNTRHFDLRTDPAFAGLETVVERYVRDSGRARKHNRLCIVGEQAADGSHAAWLIWPRASRIVLWEAGNDDLAASRRILDLRKDVVASDRYLRGSTYRVTRRWVDQLVAGCARDGTHLDIELSDIP